MGFVRPTYGHHVEDITKYTLKMLKTFHIAIVRQVIIE